MNMKCWSFHMSISHHSLWWHHLRGRWWWDRCHRAWILSCNLLVRKELVAHFAISSCWIISGDYQSIIVFLIWLLIMVIMKMENFPCIVFMQYFMPTFAEHFQVLLKDRINCHCQEMNILKCFKTVNARLWKELRRSVNRRDTLEIIPLKMSFVALLMISWAE